jgi:ABC-2 type transport system ATP-binding protein
VIAELTSPVEAPARPAVRPAIDAVDVTRRFKDKLALKGVSLSVAPGEIAALLGPNGAGKTTLLRILSGLLDPDAGVVRILGENPRTSPLSLRQRVGLVPSGDRSFYLRLSGLENLMFFGRLHGLSRRAAAARALEVLEDVGLQGAERKPVGIYSHGMQKRLSVARALLMRADVLLIDEATHDLDPEGARQVRELVTAIVERGCAVLWATQRLEEIRGFADSVTLINEGTVRFVGSVPELMGYAVPQRFLLRMHNGSVGQAELQPVLQRALGGVGTIAPLADGGEENFVLSLAEDAALGDALRSLLALDVQILACRGESSEIEDAFIRLTREEAAGS